VLEKGSIGNRVTTSIKPTSDEAPNEWHSSEVDHYDSVDSSTGWLSVSDSDSGEIEEFGFVYAGAPVVLSKITVYIRGVKYWLDDEPTDPTVDVKADGFW